MSALQVHQDKNLSQTVLKAMVVMEFLASTSKPSSAQEVADACNIPRPTVYRLLSTLASGGYVAIGPTGQYRLGTQVIVLSRQVLNNLDWPPIARPLLRELALKTQETVHFGLLDADEILYVDKVESPQSVRMVSTIGTRNPLYCTAMGKAILAFLPPGKRNLLLEAIDLTLRTPHTLTEKAALLKHLAIVRSVGYAIDDEENEEGIRCVAAPIFDRIGTPFGAISLAGPAYRLPVRRLQELSIHVVKAAEIVSRHHS